MVKKANKPKLIQLEKELLDEQVIEISREILKLRDLAYVRSLLPVLLAELAFLRAERKLFRCLSH